MSVKLGWSIEALRRSTKADSDVLGAIFGKGPTESSHLTSSHNSGRLVSSLIYSGHTEWPGMQDKLFVAEFCHLH